MKRIGIFYGSETGTTADAAQKIAGELGIDKADIHNVAKTSPTATGDYDVLLFGSSTWGDGELQSDWYDFLAGAKALDLKGKKMAFFGCGDESMSSTFCDAVGELYDAMKDTEAEYIGRFDTGDYDFESSAAVRDGEAVGLLLDEVNHADTADARIKAWCEKIKQEE